MNRTIFLALLLLFVLNHLNQASEIKRREGGKEEENLDPCSSNPCGQFGFCTSSFENQTSFSCYCFGEFYGDRCELEYANACESEPCQNSATCYRIKDSYYCDCPFLYYGDNCERKFEGIVIYLCTILSLYQKILNPTQIVCI